jgi:hypothetical protein
LDGDVLGTEHIGSEDTFDGDYGRLLDRAAKHGKVVASPAGTSDLWRVPFEMSDRAA